ncbi:hypothetical protein M3Y94_00747500 [Aphelenchoides besseyi]|nr:hypothetical protein M3Y94_00747500 [Aphelenchoides besseyi]
MANIGELLDAIFGLIRTILNIFSGILQSLTGGDAKAKPTESTTPAARPITPPTKPDVPDFVRASSRDPNYQTIAMLGTEDVFEKKKSV